MSLREIKQEVLRVYSKMQKRYPQVKWEAEHFMIDLVEEIGELANALLVERGHKFSSRQKTELDDAFFDVLFDLILLAESLDVDLDTAFKNGISEFEKRLDSGEFDEKG